MWCYLQNLFYLLGDEAIKLLEIIGLKTFIILLIPLIYFIYNYITYIRKLPPGPWGLPIVGCLLQVNRGSPYAWYMKMSAKYGDLFSVKLGNHLVLCVGSAQFVRLLFSRRDSIGRPQTPLNRLLGGLGIVMSDGLLWKRQRHFLDEKFRNLGVLLRPNEGFENVIITEIEELKTELEATKGEAIDPTDIIGRHVHNVICQLMMSFRFEKNDEKLTTFTERITRGMNLYGLVHIGEYLEQYLKLPGKQAVLREIKSNLGEVSKFHADFIAERIEARKRKVEYNEPKDLLDCYLNEIQNENFSGTVSGIFLDADPEKQIVQVMNDLFSAGMQTVRTTLLWCLVMAVREPASAAKVREELRKEMSLHNPITLQHRSQLPYVEAFIYETMRRVTIVPLGTTHINNTSWTIGEYFIPPGTHIIPLISKISMDPELYPEPEMFKPERFMSNGQLSVPKHFLQFGAGQRMCLGIQLAKMELFLFFANLMNNFEFCLPEGHEMPGLLGVIGSTHAPSPFALHFKRIL